MPEPPLFQVTKRDPRYREKKGSRLGKLNIEGRKAAAKIFLQALRSVPEAFGYSIDKLAPSPRIVRLQSPPNPTYSNL